MVLEIRGLSKSFGGLKAVNKVDLDVRKGEIIGLIGPNGAGKTTLFNLITGLLPVDEGKIFFEGKNITGMKPHEICQLGIGRTFQLVRPFSNMTVLQNVMTGAFLRHSNRNETWEKAREALTFVGLWDKKDTLAKHLTGPDKKLMELVRALSTKPRLLLIDELMAGLNPAEVDETGKLLMKIHDEGITICLVEHVMRVIMSISERVVVLSFGTKIAEGTPKEVSRDEEVIKAYLGRRYAARA